MRRATGSDTGAALVTVLFLIAVMSAVAVAMLDVVSRARVRSAGLGDRGQAIWYSRGAEELALSGLAEVMLRTEGRVTNETPGLNEVLTFPVDGGVITARTVDATNCFNVNGLVAPGEPGSAQANEDSAAMFQVVLQGIGFNDLEARRLTDSLIDWIDNDNVPRDQGAEEAYYISTPGREPPPNTLVRDMGALSAVRGFEDPVVREALAGTVCARGDYVALRLNVNTLTPEEAPLLAAATEGALETAEAERLIRDRGLGGWQDLEAMFAEPAFSNIAPEKRGGDRLGVTSVYFDVRGEVVYRSAYVPFVYLIETDAGGAVEVKQRRVGSY